MPSARGMVDRIPEYRALRILYFVDSLNAGGSEGQMAQVAALLIDKGHELTIGCLHAEGQYFDAFTDRGINVVEFRTNGSLLGPAGIRQMFRMVLFLRKHKFDVVHTHDLYSNLFALPAAWIAQVPKVISSRRDLASWWWYTPRNRQILRWIQSLSSAVVANSEAVRSYLVTEDRFNPARVKVLRNGVADNPFCGLPVLRSQLFPGCTPADKIIIVVANMHVPTKGHTHIIQAAQAVIAKVPAAKFVLIGDGLLRPELQQQVSDLHLTNHFLFMGARRDVAQLLAAADIGALGSLAEGLPNAVLEYLAAGLPVVATRVGGIPEIIDDGINGLLVEPANPGEMAAALIKLLDCPSLATRLAVAGQRSVKERFGFEQLLSKLELLYQDDPS